MATLGGVSIFLGLDQAQFTSGLRRAERDLRSGTGRMNRSLATLDRGVGRIERSFKGFVAQTLRANISIAAVAGSAGLGLLVRRSVESADSIAKTADAVGLSTKALQEYRTVAELSGVSTATLDSGAKAFTKRLGELQAGTGQLVSFLKRFDTALLDDLRAAQSTDAALDRLFDTMSKLGRQTDRAALSAAAFGRTAGVELTNVVRGGTQELDAMRQRARDLGLILEDPLLRKAELLNDEFSLMGQVLSTEVTRGILTATPQIEGMAERFKGLTGEVGFLVDKLLALNNLTNSILDFEAIADFGRRLGLPQFGRETPAPAGGFFGESNTALPGGNIPRLPPPARTPPPKPSGGGGGGRSNILPDPRSLEDVMRLEANRNAILEQGRTVFEMTRTVQELFTAEQERLNRLLRAGAIDHDTYNRAVAQAREEMDRASEGQNILGRSIENVTDRALSGQIQTWDDLKRVALDAIGSIINDWMRAQSIFGGGGSGASGGGILQSIIGGIGGLFGGGGFAAAPTGAANPLALGIGGIRGRASGGPVTAGTPFLVGERGPEVFVPGAGGNIVPNDKLSGGGGMTVFIDAKGADKAAIARLEAGLRQLDATVDRRAVGAMMGARSRGVMQG